MGQSKRHLYLICLQLTWKTLAKENPCAGMESAINSAVSSCILISDAESMKVYL